MCTTMFNTIVPPNGEFYQWAYCSGTGSGACSNISNADSYHPGGVNACMADGSVKFFKNSINQRTWWSLGTIAGGEVISRLPLPGRPDGGRRGSPRGNGRDGRPVARGFDRAGTPLQRPVGEGSS